MNRITTKLLLIPALCALSAQAQSNSVTAYNTFGANFDYNASSGWLVDGTANPPQPYVAEGYWFIPTASGYLSQIDLAICADNGNTSVNDANIYLAANHINVPGTTLESFLNVPIGGYFGENNPVLTLSSILQPYITAGTPYWIWVQAATPQAVLTVNENDTGISTPQAQSFAVNSWQDNGLRTSFAFDVDVTSVPEPASLGLMLGGIVATTSFLRSSRRRRG